MGQYIEFFECAYPQVLPDAMAPYLTLNSGGVNTALASEVPQQMSYTGNPGLGCGCGCAGGCGLAAFQLTAPDGYFSSGMDFSQWGLAEYATVLVGIWMVFSSFWTAKSAVGYAREGVRRSRSRKKRIAAASKSRGFF